MEKVYVLINVKRGAAKKVHDSVRKLKCVTETSIVSGRYDVFAKIEGKSLAEITDVIINQIHKIEGVERTESLIALSLEMTGEEGPVLRAV
ncbi:MAG: Lrp/AsnC ligand binding domain-containing protein [Candidatus Thermoplasmatota archaeon]|nr:Lrp/AsnC ligand binding domain-containing protein [Candidatus Thermoplasmatota archaeon]